MLFSVIEKKYIYITENEVSCCLLPLLLVYFSVFLCQNNLININSKIRLHFQLSADRFLCINHSCNSTVTQLILVQGNSVNFFYRLEQSTGDTGGVSIIKKVQQL